MVVSNLDAQAIRLPSPIPCLAGTDMHRVVADALALNQFNIRNGGVAGDEMNHDIRR